MKNYNYRKRKNYEKERRAKQKGKKKTKLLNKKRVKFLNNDWKYKISLLPREIEKIIYIWTWKLFWRSYVPLTAKIPSWQQKADIMQKILWEARVKNIHFLHLPFNTLPENKKWIMGCRCNFCINDTEVDIIEKHCHSLVQYRNSSYFPDQFMPYETVGNWNEYIIPCKQQQQQPLTESITLVKIFDPLCGSYKENKFSKRLREGYPFKFSSFII